MRSLGDYSFGSIIIKLTYRYMHFAILKNLPRSLSVI